MNTIIRSVMTASLVAALAAGFTLPAGARDNVVSTIVKFGDLDLSTAEGGAALYARIRKAAQQVCWEADPFGSTRRCVDKAITDAVTKVNRPALFAVYNDHYKQSLPKSPLLSQAH